MRRKPCTNCKRIYTNNGLCLHCKVVDPEKGYPSKIAVVYPEGSVHQKLATYAFNHLAAVIDETPELACELAEEFGCEENDLHAALEELYTEN